MDAKEIRARASAEPDAKVFFLGEIAAQLSELNYHLRCLRTDSGENYATSLSITRHEP